MALAPTSSRASAAGANVVTISDTTLGVDTASIDLQSIPGTYTHLWCIASIRSTAAAVGDFLLVKVNNDGGANYYDQGVFGNLTTVSASQDTGQTRGFTFDLIGDTGPANAFTTLDFRLPSYLSGKTKTMIYAAGEMRTLTTNFHVSNQVCMWNSTAAITRLTFLPLNGPNLKAGSRVTLYGLNVS